MQFASHGWLTNRRYRRSSSHINLEIQLWSLHRHTYYCIKNSRRKDITAAYLAYRSNESENDFINVKRDFINTNTRIIYILFISLSNAQVCRLCAIETLAQRTNFVRSYFRTITRVVSSRLAIASGNRTNPQNRGREVVIMEATTELYDRSPDFSIDNGISWLTDGSVANRFTERSSVNSLAPLHSIVTIRFADANDSLVCVCVTQNERKHARIRKIRAMYFRISGLWCTKIDMLRFPRSLLFPVSVHGFLLRNVRPIIFFKLHKITVWLQTDNCLCNSMLSLIFIALSHLFRI